jgi:tRNA-specific 2-thiouridylase
LGQSQLAHVLFPIGNYTKGEVRSLAQRLGLSVAGKKESQDLCFLKDGDYRRFLSDYSLHVNDPGPILDTDGRELGQHRGLAHYTIGQRKGLGLSAAGALAGPLAEPLFVLSKDAPRNALIVGTRELLGRRELVAGDVNWVSGTPPVSAVRAQVKIRYKAVAMPAEVRPLSDGGAAVHFDEPVYAITPGQGAVFYDGDVCLGGGIIQ